MYHIFELASYIDRHVTGNEVSSEVRTLVIRITISTFTFSCIISGCLTFGLTLLRTILICNPFYRIKVKLCVSGLILIGVVIVSLMQMFMHRANMLPKNLWGYNIYNGKGITLLSPW